MVGSHTQQVDGICGGAAGAHKPAQLYQAQHINTRDAFRTLHAHGHVRSTLHEELAEDNIFCAAASVLVNPY